MSLVKSGKIWPIGIVFFFVLLAIVNGFLVYSGLTTKAYTTTENAYEDALSYEDTISALKRAQQYEHKIILSISPENPSQQKTVTLSMYLGDAIGIFQRGRIEFNRFSDASLDQKYEFRLQDAQNYALTLNKPLPDGGWQLRLILTDSAGEDYLWEKKIILRQGSFQAEL